MGLLAHCYMFASILLCGFSVVQCGCLAVAKVHCYVVARWLLTGPRCFFLNLATLNVMILSLIRVYSTKSPR